MNNDSLSPLHSTGVFKIVLDKLFGHMYWKSVLEVSFWCGDGRFSFVAVMAGAACTKYRPLPPGRRLRRRQGGGFAAAKAAAPPPPRRRLRRRQGSGSVVAKAAAPPPPGRRRLRRRQGGSSAAAKEAAPPPQGRRPVFYTTSPSDPYKRETAKFLSSKIVFFISEKYIFCS